MKDLLNKEMVETIRRLGTGDPNLDRMGILEEHRLRYDVPADTVIISGCQVIARQAATLRSLANILDRQGKSYSFLSKEYCCGNHLYRPAMEAQDAEALNECRNLSKEFVGVNIQQAKRLGARRLAIFCSPCYPIYKYAFPEEDILFYPALINEAMGRITCRMSIDYYAGCYRLHRKLAPVPMDLQSTDEVFRKLDGLEVHRIDAPRCCFTPEGLAHMIKNVQTDLMVHVCTGCYYQAKSHIPEGSRTQVMMLPQFVEKVMIP